MDGNAINRRSAIAIMGATSVLAACSGTGAPAPKPKLDIYGRNPSFGPEPNVDKWGAGLPNFEPQFITLVRISSPEPWKISVNHASFDVSKVDGKYPDETDRKKLALKLFSEVALKDVQPRKRLNAVTSGKLYKRHNIPHETDTDIVGFGEFGASQQTEIYIWIDTPKAVIDRNYVISFSPKTGTGKDADPNDSFFAKGLAESVYGGPLILVRNYFCTYDDSSKKFTSRKPTTKPANYAMNIHFSIPGDGAEMIPMVIDPNTGNGGGFEP